MKDLENFSQINESFSPPDASNASGHDDSLFSMILNQLPLALDCFYSPDNTSRNIRAFRFIGHK